MMGIAILVSVWAFLLKILYRILGSFSRQSEKWLRVVWHSVILGVSLIFFLIAVNYALETTNGDLDTKHPGERAFSANPVLNFFFI
jgi:hypothetical protein